MQAKLYSFLLTPATTSVVDFAAASRALIPGHAATVRVSRNAEASARCSLKARNAFVPFFFDYG